jgi:hypothetical protein
MEGLFFNVNNGCVDIEVPVISFTDHVIAILKGSCEGTEIAYSLVRTTIISHNARR